MTKYPNSKCFFIKRTNLNSTSFSAIVEQYHHIIVVSSIPLQSIALLGRLEEGQRELLGDDTNVEVNQAGARNVYANGLDGQPEKELLGSNTGEIGKHGVVEPAGNVALVSNGSLELGVARGGIEQVKLEEAGDGVDGEIGNALGKEAHGKAVGLQDVIEGGLKVGGNGISRRRRRKGEDYRQDCRENCCWATYGSHFWGEELELDLDLGVLYLSRRLGMDGLDG